MQYWCIASKKVFLQVATDYATCCRDLYAYKQHGWSFTQRHFSRENVTGLVTRAAFSCKPVTQYRCNYIRNLLACEYSRLSFAPATTCETRRETSAIHGQKFHTDDVNLSGIRTGALIGQLGNLHNVCEIQRRVIAGWTKSTPDAAGL